MPQEELFSADKKPTTASVLVATHPGATLGPEQVQAIVHLVASSVEGLDPKQVTVTDSAGTVLSAAGDGLDSVADTRAQQVKGFEDRMQGSVGDVLTRIVGPGNSAVEVTADLNFDKTVTHTTRYFNDPKIKPLTTSRSDEKYTGAGGGTAPTAWSAPTARWTPAAGASPGTGSNYRQEVADIDDNAIDKTIEQKEAAPGNVRSLHVGVVLDTRSLAGVDPPAGPGPGHLGARHRPEARRHRQRHHDAVRPHHRERRRRLARRRPEGGRQGGPDVDGQDRRRSSWSSPPRCCWPGSAAASAASSATRRRRTSSSSCAAAASRPSRCRRTRRPPAAGTARVAELRGTDAATRSPRWSSASPRRSPAAPRLAGRGGP